MSDIDYSRYYRRWHDKSDEHFNRQVDHSRRFLRDHLPSEIARGSVLEIGCGMGFMLEALRLESFKQVAGIDSDRGQVEASLERGLPAELVSIDQTIPYLTAFQDPIDVVVAIDVLEHIPPMEALILLRLIKKILRPGGVFLCQVPNANSSVAARYRYHDWTHVTSFTEASLDFLLFNGGFSDISVAESSKDSAPKGVDMFRPSSAAWVVRRIFRALHRLEYAVEIGRQEAAGIPLSPNIVAVARKGLI